MFCLFDQFPSEPTPYSRPQRDGPGLRAITIIKFANHLLDRRQSTSYVTGTLWPILELVRSCPNLHTLKVNYTLSTKHISVLQAAGIVSNTLTTLKSAQVKISLDPRYTVGQVISFLQLCFPNLDMGNVFWGLTERMVGPSYLWHAP